MFLYSCLICSLYVYIYACMDVGRQVRTYVRMYVCIYVCMYVSNKIYLLQILYCVTLYITFCIFFYIYIYLYILNILSGDKQQALNHIQMLLESRSEFLNEFIMEGLLFSSSLYMTLIWLRVFLWDLHNPKTVKEKMNPQLEGFRLHELHFQRNL